MFELKNYIERLFLIYGNVRDEFILTDNRTVALDRYLDLYLREQLKYESVMFLDTKGLYTFDFNCYQRLDKSNEKKKTAKKSLLKLKRSKNNIIVDYPSEKPEIDSNGKIRKTYNGDIIEILQFVMHHIQRSDVKIAFIIYEGSLFEKFPQSSDVWIQFQGLLRNGIFQLDSSNQNIFVWADGEALQTLSDRFARLGLDFLFSLDHFENKTFGLASLKNITCPKKDEIFKAMLLKSLSTGVYPDYSELEKKSSIIAGMLSQKEESLKEFRQHLNSNEDYWIHLKQKYSLKNEEAPALDKLENMVGMVKVFLQIKRIVCSIDKTDKCYEADYSKTPERFLKPQTKKLPHIPHLAILGNPGTGKTTVARLIGSILKEEGVLESGQLIEVSRQDLVAGFQGQTAIKVGEQVAKAMGGILFIDEAYQLVTGEGDDFGKEALAELVKAMSTFAGQFMVIFAGYENETLQMLSYNPGSERRVTKIKLPDYSKEDLTQIMLQLIGNYDHTISEDIVHKASLFCENILGNVEKFGGNHFGNADVIVKQLAFAKQNAQVFKSKSIETNHFEYPEFFKALVGDNEDLDNLIGLDEIKLKLKQLSKQLKFEKSLSPGHYIFTGNSGTGKTIVARQMAKRFCELGLLKSAKINKYTASQLIVGHEGGTQEYVNKILKQSLGGVLFIDEAHQLAGNNGHPNSYGKLALQAILPFMEDHKDDFSLIFAGYPKEVNQLLGVDPGLKGRFKETLIFQDYTYEEMVQIFHKLFNENSNYKLDGVCDKDLIGCFTTIKEVEGNSFSNARTVRNFIDKLKMEAMNDCTSKTEKVLISQKNITKVLERWI